ncbi:hypothetical protein PAXRUDRAFT_16494 [Paxillus rubicundulus Ve08.2h10]|uniref:Uncharacterized protein n=1 Tax=Paxillus rubicundulus Ve08.2h10 TaxID=930991 RepID=A0A0D0DE79_9AGAM|nr:hypothetical protein PAXRUDRAFT_16494 [Paxillus rubicundulus Ve08.2h10]
MPKASEQLVAGSAQSYTSPVQQAVIESLAMVKQCSGLHAMVEDIPDKDKLSVPPSMGELKDLFATIPDDLPTDSLLDEPTTYKAAMDSPQAPNGVPCLRRMPVGQTIMHGKPIFKVKHDQDGKPVCFKAWINFNKTFSPTA